MWQGDFLNTKYLQAFPGQCRLVTLCHHHTPMLNYDCYGPINGPEPQKYIYCSLILIFIFQLSFQNNIGHKLLVKQGWTEGQGLGKQLQGIASLTIYTVSP